MYKIVISFLGLLIMQGCSTTTNSNIVYEKYTPNQIQKQQKIETIDIKEVQSVTTGSIKGYISSLVFIKGFWEYEVKSSDLSNKKLSQAQFKDPKKLAKEGDFVYAVLENGRVKDFYLIEKANIVKKKVTKVKTLTNKSTNTVKKKYKRTKKRHIIDVPVSENISLD